MSVDGTHIHIPPDPAAPVVTPVVDTSDHLVAPVVDHTEKITRIEERQAQHQEELVRQLAALEERLQTASGAQVARLEEKIATLEGKLAQEAAPPESVELELPEVETSPAPPEKIRQGLRHRRKSKRSK